VHYGCILLLQFIGSVYNLIFLVFMFVLYMCMWNDFGKVSSMFYCIQFVYSLVHDGIRIYVISSTLNSNNDLYEPDLVCIV
jgi:hypothetical protein